MRFVFAAFLVSALLLIGFTVSRCGSVTISNLDSSDFVTPTPTP